MTTKTLIEICGYKIQVMRKAVLNNKDLECRNKCNGYKVTCKDYTPVPINKDHYLYRKYMEDCY